ncbi:MAG TPA: hypothetical protein VHE78_07010 [Gemmatimonadaceae bacterium]|nr:hypothetical protein [Gemmatimonadaceae bacterium]
MRLSADFNWKSAHYARTIGNYILGAVHYFSSDGHYARSLGDFDAGASHSMG